MAKCLEGGVTVVKRLLEHPVFERAEYTHAWLYLLLSANDRPRSFPLASGTVNVKRGQLVRGMKTLVLKLGKSRNWVEAFLEFCSDHGMIRCETHRFGHLITILNYEAYNPPPQGQEDLPENGAIVTPDNQPEPPVEAVAGSQSRAPLAEFPDDSEIEEYCRNFTDLSRGITSIPKVWWLGWSASIAERGRYPSDWKTALKKRFLADWEERRWKARPELSKTNGVSLTSESYIQQRDDLLFAMRVARDSNDTARLAELKEAYKRFKAQYNRDGYQS